jgi:protein-S-isoprenylcysteine O-methyltransferase Ste14
VLAYFEMSEATPDTAGIVVPPPAYFVVGVALGWILQSVLPGAPFPPALVRVVGPALGVLGGALIVWALVAFRRHGTSADPRKPTRAVVAEGPYAFTRNPIYLSLALLTAGFALRMNLLGPLLLLPLVLLAVDRLVIAREERYLERKFSDEYRAYKARVRRWL